MACRAAVIGCGRIGSELADDARSAGVQSHAGAYAACPDTILAALCDVDLGKAARCAARWKVSAYYDDPGRMLLAEQPEIVSICTPDSTHAEMLHLALDTPSVRGILAEKPLATSLQEAEEIVEAAARRSVSLAVNYSRRYAPSHIRVKEQIAGGLIGAIQSVSGNYTKGIIHNGTHWLDLARFLIGDVASVQGIDVRSEGGPDPTVDALVRFRSGVLGRLAGCRADAFTVFEMDVVGTRGRLRLLDNGQTIESYAVGDSPHYSGYRVLLLEQTTHGGMEDLLLHAVNDLVRCLTGGGEPACSGEDGLAALRLALEIRDSACALAGQPAASRPARSIANDESTNPAA